MNVVGQENIDIITCSVYDRWCEDTLLYSLCDEDIKDFMNDYYIIKHLLINLTKSFADRTHKNIRLINKLDMVYEHLQCIFDLTRNEGDNCPEYPGDREMFAIME